MNVVFAIAILLLAVSVIVLFAMLGELASRLQSTSASRDLSYQPLELADTTIPGEFPSPLPSGLDTVVALSSACLSCRALLRDAKDLFDALGSKGGVILACRSEEDGKGFLTQAGVSAARRSLIALDPGGEWLRHHLELDVSPSVIFLSGADPRGFAFGSVQALRQLLAENSQ